MKFEEYCSQVEKLMTMGDNEKFKLWFEILDLDNDGKISVNDILSSMQRQLDTDIMNMNDFEELIKYQKQLSKLASSDLKSYKIGYQEKTNKRINFIQNETTPTPNDSFGIKTSIPMVFWVFLDISKF